jgi:hypothetical protein
VYARVEVLEARHGGSMEGDLRATGGEGTNGDGQGDCVSQSTSL